MAKKTNPDDSQDSSQNEPDDARGKGGSPFVITNVIETTQKPKFWIWLIILIAALYFAGQKGWLKAIPWSGFLTWIFFLAFIIFIIYGIATSGRQVNGIHNDARFWVALALFIWLLDMWPSSFSIDVWWLKWLGDTYTGFLWPVNFSIPTTLYAVLASTATLVFLYLNMVFDIIEKKYIGFILGFLFILFVNNILAPNFFKDSFLGINFVIPYGIILLIMFFAIAIVILYKIKGRIDPQIHEYLGDLFMILIFAFFWINNGWMYNLKAVLHALFIVMFGFLFIARKDSKGLAHILIPLLLIADFYGYGLLWSTDYLILKFIPILVLFVVIYCYHKTEDKYSLWTFIFIVTIMLILSLQAYGYQPSGNVEFTAREDGFEFGHLLSAIGNNLKFATEKSLSKATGGYYDQVFLSQVEKNQYEPLGVYFTNIRLAQPIYYSDEDVTLWATVKSRTLNDPVVVNFSCSRWENGVRKEADRNLDILIPKEPFTVYTFEETDVECTFNQTMDVTKLPIGTSTVTLSASYNFETSSYQKLYFIDRERLRAMTRENIDPYKEFGITDKEPRTIYTNGPVEVALKMQYLTPVSDDTLIHPNFGILLQNRDMITDKAGQPVGKWDGKIQKINDLLLILPEGMELDIGTCRPAGFIPVKDTSTNNVDNYCTETCKSLCEKTCSVFSQPSRAECDRYCDNPQSAYSGAELRQEARKYEDQIEASSRCKIGCPQSFKSESNENYNAYKMDVSSLYAADGKKEFSNIDRHRTFGCRVKISSKVIENVPITTKYVRAVARYDYAVDNSYAVDVDKAPTETISAQTSIETIAQDQGISMGSTGIDANTLKAIAIVESGLRHCKDGSIVCPKDQVIFSGSSIGVMQINIRDSPGSQWAQDASAFCGSGKNAYDYDCNVKLGIKILKEKYDLFGAGRIFKCPQLNYEKTYTGWDAALRGYNGWGCQAKDRNGNLICPQNCLSDNTCSKACLGMINYVENVRANEQKIKNNDLQGVLKERSVQFDEFIPRSGDD